MISFSFLLPNFNASVILLDLVSESISRMLFKFRTAVLNKPITIAGKKQHDL